MEVEVVVLLSVVPAGCALLRAEDKWPAKSACALGVLMTAERMLTADAGRGVAGEEAAGEELVAWLTRRSAAAMVGEERDVMGVFGLGVPVPFT